MLSVVQEPAGDFTKYGEVPIRFEVESVLDIRRSPDGSGFLTSERTSPEPWWKDYDGPAGERPTRWPRRFDVSGWAVFAAFDDAARVGGAVGVMDSAGVDMLEGRTDLAVLWDLRVAPAWRGHGVGSLLLEAVERWARDGGARELKVETQDINVPACRFYEGHGFRLRGVNPGAYADLPGETQLLWYKELRASE